MDIARPDIFLKKRRRRILFAISSLAVLAVVTVGLSRLKPAVPSVDSPVYSDTVKRGPMLREVRGNGALVPEEIRWLTATSPGRVENILLLAGVTVKADTVLVELSNPELEQAAFDAESLEAEADESLRKDGLVANLTAKRSRSKADDLETRYQLEQKRLEISAKSAHAQRLVQEAELSKLRKQDQLKKQQVAALKVRAGFDGVLQKVGDVTPLQVGQQVLAGANIARIANPNKLKAEIKIAETQAKDIQHGQAAEVDTRNGKIPGHVVRIDPSVQNGTVTVDVALDGPLPKGARPDLSVDATITLEKLDDVLFVGRPVNGQPDSKVSLFKLTDGGREAVRIPVQLGRSSVSSIEILDGLQAGDQIILSDMSQWDAHDRLKLK